MCSAGLMILAPTTVAAADAGGITLASTSDGGLKGNGNSELPALTPDGRVVVFFSYATNLDESDTDAFADVYVKDLVTGDLTLVSTSDQGVKGNGDSMSRGAISEDGTKVAFFSMATNLDPSDSDDLADVYVKDLVTGDLTLVSASDNGVKGNRTSFGPILSADGSRVGFYSWATNLDPLDPDPLTDIYVKDLATGDLALASTSDEGIKGNDDSYSRGAMSADGSVVAFWSHATNLDPADPDAVADIYVKNLITGDIALASTSSDGVKGNAASYGQRLSADGRVLAFHSDATNLDSADTDELDDVYVKDLVTGELTLASTTAEGVKGDGESEEPTLSADGSIVAFYSEAANLDSADTDELDDVYVKDLVTGELTLASTSDEGVKGDGGSAYPRLSADGSIVAFYSEAANLDPGDPDTIEDVYVKDLRGSVVQTRGHAHTDYSGDGEAGPGDVHVLTTAGSAAGSEGPPEGRVRYEDLRPDPPGDAPAPFRCTGEPTSVHSISVESAQVDGTVRCRGLRRATTFLLVITDRGPNPPSPDSYRLTLFDRDGRAVYEWADETTVGLGNLVVLVT
jgi:Tol biopolymer transport system component